MRMTCLLIVHSHRVLAGEELIEDGEYACVGAYELGNDQ